MNFLLSYGKEGIHYPKDSFDSMLNQSCLTYDESATLAKMCLNNDNRITKLFKHGEHYSSIQQVLISRPLAVNHIKLLTPEKTPNYIQNQILSGKHEMTKTHLNKLIKLPYYTTHKLIIEHRWNELNRDQKNYFLNNSSISDLAYRQHMKNNYKY